MEMGVVPQPTIFEGSFFFSFDFFNSPKGEVRHGFRTPLEDGIIDFIIVEDRLVLELLSIQGSVESLLDQWITPHLRRDVSRSIMISFTWKDGRFVDFEIDRTKMLRGSENDTLNIHSKPRLFKLDDSVIPSSHPSRVVDRGGANKARVRHLRQTLERLQWASDSLSRGNRGAILDISVALRSLLATGNPTLINTAKEVGYDLVVFIPRAVTEESHFPKFAEMGATAIESVASAIPNRPDCVEVALDAWLEWPAILVGQDVLSHRKLIKLIADKFGAHNDIDKIDQVEHFLSQHHSGVDLGALNGVFKQYSELTINLALRFLYLLDQES